IDVPAFQPRTRRHAAAGRWARRLGMPREGRRRRFRGEVEAFFGRYDALITPALATPPIAAGPWAERSWLANVVANATYAPFAAPWNLAGVPAGVVPRGRHSGGTPLSVQVVCAPGGEATVLRLMLDLHRAP
ncbi:MAG TPA: amidase family protein, partial [Longimicrobiales bacterium]|nr:amidase family protein [Longimicrobiales bacterium]